MFIHTITNHIWKWVLWGTVLSTVACGEKEVGDSSAPVEKLFLQQLSQSCEPGAIYVKQVQNLTREGVAPEVKEYLLPGLSQGGDSTLCLLTTELAMAFEDYYEESQIKDNFQITQIGDTLHAQVIAGQERSVGLQSQSIWMDEEEGVLRYVAARYYEEYWLYTSKKNIEVHFGPSGNYLSHRLEAYTKILSISTPFHAEIIGGIK